jgi:hypothetical protein
MSKSQISDRTDPRLESAKSQAVADLPIGVHSTLLARAYEVIG